MNLKVDILVTFPVAVILNNVAMRMAFKDSGGNVDCFANPPQQAMHKASEATVQMGIILLSVYKEHHTLVELFMQKDKIHKQQESVKLIMDKQPDGVVILAERQIKENPKTKQKRKPKPNKKESVTPTDSE